jgi:hypothetical protein
VLSFFIKRWPAIATSITTLEKMKRLTEAESCGRKIAIQSITASVETELLGKARQQDLVEMGLHLCQRHQISKDAIEMISRTKSNKI